MIAWLCGVFLVCLWICLSIRRMSRSRYNDCLAVWCVFCLSVDLFIYQENEQVKVQWLLGCVVCVLSVDLFIYQENEQVKVQWLLGCVVCVLSVDLFIYQENEQVKVQWLLGCVVCVLSVCESVYLSIRRMSMSRYNDCLAVWCVFFLSVDFFFLAFPSYISGVHHFWVRFLRMWRFFNLTIKVVTFRLRGWCVLGVFLLPAFTRLGHERQDLLSPCDEMHVCTD